MLVILPPYVGTPSQRLALPLFGLGALSWEPNASILWDDIGAGKGTCIVQVRQGYTKEEAKNVSMESPDIVQGEPENKPGYQHTTWRRS